MCLRLSGNGILAVQEEQLTATVQKLDPRAERTRSALMRAFNSLVLSRGYDGVMPVDVAEVAGVARSTLYEHFAGKEDMLRQSMLPILKPLAECVGSVHTPPRLELVLEHIRSSRRMARELLNGRTRTVAARTLAELIEARLEHVPASRPAMPRTFIAAYLANGILGLIDEWLSGREACSAAVLASALQATTHAAAAAARSGEARSR
jgi:AcrR family transcriptional regulator